MHANSNANALSKAMNTQETRNLLNRMKRIKDEMIRVPNTDPKLKTKMYDAGRRLDILRRILRRAQDKAYRNYNMAKKR